MNSSLVQGRWLGMRHSIDRKGLKSFYKPPNKKPN